MVCWFSPENKLQVRGKYTIRHTTREARAIVQSVDYKVDINTLHKIEDDRNVGLNELGRIRLRTSAPLFHDPYNANPS